MKSTRVVRQSKKVHTTQRSNECACAWSKHFGLFAEHTTERTVREFVNEILLGIFFWWMNHYLNDLPRMTEDLCGSKRKKGDPV